MENTEEVQDTQALELEPEMEPKQSKSTRKQLKESLAQIDKLLKFKSMPSRSLSNLAIERSGLIKLLLQIEHDEKTDKNLVLNEQLTTRVAELEKENAELKQNELQSRANQRVQPQTPDNRVPALQEQVSTLEELLKTVATLARSCDIESRTRHAVSLVIKYGRRKEPMSAVEGLGVDFSSVAVALQKSETELLGLLQQAQQEGTGTPIWRAVLAVKYQVQVDGHGKQRYHDEFDPESSLYADSL